MRRHAVSRGSGLIARIGRAAARVPLRMWVPSPDPDAAGCVPWKVSEEPVWEWGETSDASVVDSSEKHSDWRDAMERFFSEK